MKLAPIITAAAEYGIIARGGFAVDAQDAVPDIDIGGKLLAAKYLLLFGNAGSSMWAAFSASIEYRDNRPDPLNRWSARIGQTIAAQFSARALFPFGDSPRPHPPHPFVRWGKKAESLQNSRLGLLIHPQFGLWHAYRFALAFAETPAQHDNDNNDKGSPPAPAPDNSSAQNICRQCTTKPCRPACPVAAFGDDGYDVQACYRYLAANPDSPCMTHGCQARVSCPAGAAYRYDPPHAAFHMRAFVDAMAAKFNGHE